MKLSVVIPSYRDPLLQKTINSLLENAAEEIEIIAVLDGYWPTVPLEDNPSLRILHLGKNRGMRGAINAGVEIARGEYIMRTDEHCMFGKGYDVILTRNMDDNWIVVPRRYFLDVEKWEVMPDEPVDCEKLVVDSGANKFAGQRWHSRAREFLSVMIYETMAMQGSCWCMKRTWWDSVIGELDNAYGPHYQDSHEMVFKTWVAGGKLMVNKNTWYAHKHRKFPRTHHTPGDQNRATFDYCLSVWRDYYETVVRPKWGI